MSLHQQPPAEPVEIRTEMQVMETCATALVTIQDDPAALSRVMAYLNSRFRALGKR